MRLCSAIWLACDFFLVGYKIFRPCHRHLSFPLIDNAKVIKFREPSKNTGVWIYTFGHPNSHFNNRLKSQISVNENAIRYKKWVNLYITIYIYNSKSLVSAKNLKFSN